MRKIWTWIKNNPNRTMFLIPIILVAVISVSHVVAWYDIANPFNWSVYLSIAVEVGAMTALIAATNKIKGGVWFMFGLVTLIQFIGNIFYSYKEIDPNSDSFRMWVELTSPLWDMFTDSTDIPTMKRWLAVLEGGLLPIISLTSLHFFVKYEKRDNRIEEISTDETTISTINEVLEPTIDEQPNDTQEEMVSFDEYEQDVTTDHSLIEEENPEDEVIDMPTTNKVENQITPLRENRTQGEKLSQTWRNIVRQRHSGGNNGISRF